MEKTGFVYRNAFVNCKFLKFKFFLIHFRYIVLDWIERIRINTTIAAFPNNYRAIGTILQFSKLSEVYLINIKYSIVSYFFVEVYMTLVWRMEILGITG